MAGGLAAVIPYVSIARVDHWFKNSFMLLGVVLAFFYQPTTIVIIWTISGHVCSAENPHASPDAIQPLEQRHLSRCTYR